MDKATSIMVLMGCPYGGVAIMVHNDLARDANCLIINQRFIVVQVCGTLFVKTYFHCSTHLLVNYDLLYVTLDALSLELAKCPGYNIVMAGDMNADLQLSSRGANAIRCY